MPPRPSETVNGREPTRQRRPSEKVAMEVQSRAEKENNNREAAERAEERKKKKLAAEKKATERERELKNKNSQEKRLHVADSNRIVGRDPAFTTISTSSPHLDLRKLKSTVPAARKKIAASDQSTKAPGRVLTPAKAAELLKMRARFTDQSNEVDTNYATPSRDYVPQRAASPDLTWPTSDDERAMDDNHSGSGRRKSQSDDHSDQDDNDSDDDRSSIDNCPSDDNRSPSLTTGDKRSSDDDRSPSPTTGDKRAHSPAGAEWRQPVKVHATTGAKPKAGDYEVAVQNIFAIAIGIYRGYLSQEDPYPGSVTEMRWAKKAWRDGCDECGAHIYHNGEIIKLITSRSSHFRGQVKTKVQQRFKAMYGFINSTDPAIIEQNVKLSRELKTKFAFVYAERSANGNKGLYRHPIIQEVINEQWFSNRKDDGVKYSEVYKPFPKVALALVLAAIENCIDEWADGTRMNIAFTQDAYKPIFLEHLEELNKFHEFTKVLKILPTILQELHDVGRLNAKADPLGKPKRAQSPSAYVAAMEEFKQALLDAGHNGLADAIQGEGDEMEGQ